MRNPSPQRPTYYAPPIVNVNRGGGYFGGFGGVRSGLGCNGCSTALVVFIIIVVLIIIFSTMMPSSRYSDYGYSASSVPQSSYDREKLDNSNWTNDCVVDETGWINEDGSIAGLERKLRTFYDKTGIQPYVYLVGNRAELVTDDDKQQFASEYYEENIGNLYTFAFFYFDDDYDSLGFMCYEAGASALGVMDAEAVQIFAAIANQQWQSWDNYEITTEDCIANMFNRTADRIMTKSTTTKDIVKIVMIIVLVIVVVVAIIIIMNKRRKNEKERNEETRRILETPLE